MTETITRQPTIELCRNPTEWDSFVDQQGSSPFSLWGWGDAVETYGHDRYYFVAREAGEIVGALPLFHIESRLFGDKLVSLPFTSKGSVVAREDRREEPTTGLLNRTVRLADALDVDFVSLRGRDLGERPSFATRNRFVTFQVPVTDGSEAVWAGLKESRQRQVTQAMDDDELTYEVGDSSSDLREFYRLYLQSMRGHGSPPHSFGFFRTLWDRLYGDGHLRLGLVRKDGAVVNGIMDLALGDTVVQKSVVVDYEHRDRNGGSLAHWHSLRLAAENGRQIYDFGRTREGTGVYMFKKSFGGEKVWLDDYHYFPGDVGTLPDVDDDSYDRAKQVWRRLPLPVTRAVGPRLRKAISL